MGALAVFVTMAIGVGIGDRLGVQLFGEVAGDSELADFAKMLLATEIRSAQKYWQTWPGRGIYDERLAKQYMLGVVGALGALAARRVQAGLARGAGGDGPRAGCAWISAGTPRDRASNEHGPRAAWAAAVRLRL